MWSRNAGLQRARDTASRPVAVDGEVVASARKDEVRSIITHLKLIIGDGEASWVETTWATEDWRAGCLDVLAN